MKLDYETPRRPTHLHDGTDPASVALCCAPFAVGFGLTPYTSLAGPILILLLPLGTIIGLVGTICSLTSKPFWNWLLALLGLNLAGLCMNGYWVVRFIRLLAEGGC
jgi:hypothetical protein